MTKVGAFGGVGIQHDSVSSANYENKLGTFNKKNDMNVADRALDGVGETTKIDQQPDDAVVKRKEEIARSEVENQINAQVGVQLNVYV